MRRKGAILLIMTVILGSVAFAQGHAFLDRAEPRVGSTVRVPPPAVRLWFSERLEPAFSRVRVIDGTGQPVDKGDVQVAAREVSISLKPLPGGRYRVVWRAVSTDTHVSEGEFAFDVAP